MRRASGTSKMPYDEEMPLANEPDFDEDEESVQRKEGQ